MNYFAVKSTNSCSLILNKVQVATMSVIANQVIYVNNLQLSLMSY